ncbi:MAG: ribonuclease E/G [Paracoccaceae bacterium]
MKGRSIALDLVEGQPAAALIEDGVLEDLFLPPKDAGKPLPGTIFRGIPDRPLKGQGGVILRLPDGLYGYLRGAKGLRPGQPILVQVTGYAEPGKAVPVTRKLLFKSRFSIVTPDAPGLNISRQVRDEEARARLSDLAAHGMAGSSAGLILRSAAEDADPEVIAADIADMRDLAERVLKEAEAPGTDRLLDGPDAHQLAWRDWPTPDIADDREGSFCDHGVLEAIAALRHPRLELPADASAMIEPTTALVAVDVNTGADLSMAAGLKANIALARALPRALRCRGLGGQITLDLAPMPKGQRQAWEQTLRAAFRRDGVDTVMAGWTPLGHYELQRKRDRLPLSECHLP